MFCSSCHSEIDDDAEACFQCGMAVFALTQGTVLSGRYEIVQPLGRGGMGRVYKAFDRVMEEHVALKVLRSEFMRDPEMSRRFVSEIKLARKIGHRNVCRIHEYGEDGEVRYIVMEIIDGLTLKEFLHGGPLPPDAAYDVSIQVARGLNAVHELGIIHRDFKAANIMIDGAGVAKLVDFGIAKDLASEQTGPTVAGMLMGTPEYMSPEQVRGGVVGFRSDIYAMGCVVYEVFTGHAPFRGATPVATVFMHLNEDLPLAGEDAERIPPPLVPVLKRALAKDPQQRYGSVADFAEALSAACTAGGYTGAANRGGLRRPVPTATDATPAPRAHDTLTIRRPRWLARAASRPVRWALGLASLLLAAIVLRPGTPAPATASPVPTATVPHAIVAPSRLAAPAASPAAESARPPLRAAAARPPSAPPRAAALTGTLRLLVVPEARVSLDGVFLGVVSRRELPLAPGTHTVRVEHPDYQPLQRRVLLREAETQSLVIDLAEKGIRRN